MPFWRGRTSWWSRAAAVCAAAWCAIALGAQLALPAFGAVVGARRGMGHTRMVHTDGVQPRMVQSGALSDAHCGAGMPATGDRHRDARDLTQHGLPGTDHRCCTCFGPCCHATPAVVARPPATIVASVAALVPRYAPPVVPRPYRPTAPEHARPPSVGPPVGLTA